MSFMLNHVIHVEVPRQAGGLAEKEVAIVRIATQNQERGEGGKRQIGVFDTIF
jgi:hypothetical protein